MLTRAISILWLSLGIQASDGARFDAIGCSDQETNRDGIVHDEFFSGTVHDVSETSVTVSRTLPGKNPETRVFLMDTETIIEGKLKKLARVTVGYRTHDGQDHAWRIIVRESQE